MALAPKQLLCIDDDTGVLLVRKLLLESCGFATHTATNGKDGLKIFHSLTIDAVVLDYMMPEMDGSQVCSAIKKTRPETPVIMLSAYPYIQDSVLDCGDAFIGKGEDPEILLRVLQRFLNDSRAN